MKDTVCVCVCVCTEPGRGTSIVICKLLLVCTYVYVCGKEDCVCVCGGEMCTCVGMGRRNVCTCVCRGTYCRLRRRRARHTRPNSMKANSLLKTELPINQSSSSSALYSYGSHIIIIFIINVL